MPKTDHFLITCEHGGNRIPSSYRYLFTGFETLLKTHRGYDAGALALARDLARELNAPLFASTTSRLLVDLNRSIGHPCLYSEATRSEPVSVRGKILEKHYHPYRNQIEAEIAESVAGGSRVVHVAAHSFTPEIDGAVRTADIGLLYDPARSGEVELCRRWQAQLKAWAPHLKSRRNYPYAGKSDGLTATLRRRFPAENYVGIELEINQKHIVNGERHWRAFRSGVIEALRQAISQR